MEQHVITIEVLKGGFVLHYPALPFGNDQSAITWQTREIFTSSRKMNQRIKEVLEAVSTTPVDKDAD